MVEGRFIGVDFGWRYWDIVTSCFEGLFDLAVSKGNLCGAETAFCSAARFVKARAVLLGTTFCENGGSKIWPFPFTFVASGRSIWSTGLSDFVSVSAVALFFVDVIASTRPNLA